MLAHPRAAAGRPRVATVDARRADVGDRSAVPAAELAAHAGQSSRPRSRSRGLGRVPVPGCRVPEVPGCHGARCQVPGCQGAGNCGAGCQVPGAMVPESVVVSRRRCDGRIRCRVNRPHGWRRTLAPWHPGTLGTPGSGRRPALGHPAPRPLALISCSVLAPLRSRHPRSARRARARSSCSTEIRPDCSARSRGRCLRGASPRSPRVAGANAARLAG